MAAVDDCRKLARGVPLVGGDRFDRTATRMRLDWGQRGKPRCSLQTKGLSGTKSVIHAQRLFSSDVWRGPSARLASLALRPMWQG